MFSHLCCSSSTMLCISNWYSLNCEVHWSYLLLFQVWTTSGSEIPCWRAWSSRKSNMYLMARGNALPRWAVLKIVSNKSSTNFWRVPYNKITQNASSNEERNKKKCHHNTMQHTAKMSLLHAQLQMKAAENVHQSWILYHSVRIL